MHRVRIYVVVGKMEVNPVPIRDVLPKKFCKIIIDRILWVGGKIFMNSECCDSKIR